MLNTLRRWLAPILRRSAHWDAAGALARINSWGGLATAPNQQWDNPVLLRTRAEGEYRNNPTARKLIDAIVNAAVGATGINPMFKSKATQQVWEDWTRRCDVTGRHDWASALALALQTVAVSGECFVVLTFEDTAGGIPLRLQILGPEFLHTSRSGGDTYAGIKYAGSRPVGYWLYKHHPALNSVDLESVLVPAEVCFHVFRPIAPGATRGQSWLAPVLIALRELNEYLEAGLTKAKVSALFAGYVRTADGSNPLQTLAGVPQLEPGSMTRLQPGEEVAFTEPPDAGATFDPFVRAQLRRIAAGLNVPYEILSGDLSAVTFASGRHGLLEYRRTIEAVQYGLLVPQLCEPVLRKWLQLVVALGMIETADENPRWVSPVIEMLDARAETLAKVQAVRAGFMPRSEVIAAAGWRAEDIDAEIAADNARADRLGLVYDSDARRVTAQGQTQQEGDSGQPA